MQNSSVPAGSAVLSKVRSRKPNLQHPDAQDLDKAQNFSMDQKRDI